MSRGYQEILRQARSSRIKYVFNALIEIRKTYIKSDKGVETLVAGGLVERLIELLKTWDQIEESYRIIVTDICTSILGNLCMLEAARKQVIKINGINAVAEVLLTSESVSIQNRCCRCLANILLSPGSWKLVHDTAVVERIVKLLNDTDNDECKQTYIRAIRLLGQTVKHVQDLLEKNSVKCVARHLDKDRENVCQTALRCLMSLSSHCCNVEFATQMVTSGKLDFLLTAAKEQNLEAFQLLVRLSNLPNFRPEFGNADGIGIFVDMFNSEEDFYRDLKRDIVDVLSLCCKEAVNRVKLRDSGSLQTLMSTLFDEEYSLLHARVISALICFLYDQSSFDVLLDNGLVDVLIKQLNNYMGHSGVDKTGADHVEGTDVEGNLKDEVEKEHPIEEKLNMSEEKNEEDSYVIKINSQVNEFNIELKQLANNKECIVDKHEDNHVPEKNCLKEVIRTKTDTNDSKESKDSNDKLGTGTPVQRKRPMYSIDSPTYQPASALDELEHNTGAKCIERFTPPNENPPDPYSPFSNTSYYSPSEGSPEYTYTGTSHCGKTGNCYEHSPQSSSMSRSPPNMERIPRRKIVYSGISSGLSPVSSTESFKSGEHSSHGSPFNDSEDSCDIDKQTASNFSPESSPTADGSGSTSTFGFQSDCGSSSLDKSDSGSEKTQGGHEKDKQKSAKDANMIAVVKTCPQINTVEDEAKPIEAVPDLVTNLSRKCKKVSSKSVVFENNILILLSRISQMTNPSKHLVSMKTIKTLINYILFMEAPLARAARLLSRIFRNPHCFDNLLKFNIPKVVFEQLLQEENVKLLMTSVLKSRNDSLKRRRYLPSKLDTSSDDGNDSERFSAVNDSPTDDEVHPAKRQRRHSSNSKQVQSFKGTFHKQEEAVCDVGRCGIAFLEDLSEVASSSYGQGVVEKLLCGDHQTSSIDICVTLLFIIWHSNSREFYFKQLIVLDQVMSIIQDPQHRHSKMLHAAIIGLSIVTQAMDRKSKYQKKGVRNGMKWSKAGEDKSSHLTSSPVIPASSPKPDPQTCYLANKSSHDLDFVVQGERISTNRRILTKSSDIFAAMLAGHYSEAKLSAIPITDTSPHVFRYIVHYLHGCRKENCSEIRSIYMVKPTRESAIMCIDVITEADKYLLHPLKAELLDLLNIHYVIPESGLPVLKFSFLHGYESLQKNAVYTLLVDSHSVRSLIGLVCEVLDSSYKNVFLHVLEDILVE